MPVCKRCGTEVNEGSKFCGFCGEPIENISEPERSNGASRTFSIIGYVFGIVSIATVLIFGGFIFGEIGIVFSALGLKRGDTRKAKTGLVLSIVSLAINFIFIIFICVIAALV